MYLDLVLRTARQIDAKLQAWVESVSEPWSYHPATGMQCAIDERWETFVYQDRMDVYEDVNIANVWNTYRTNRIMTYRVILTCLAQEGFPLTHEVARPAREATQQLVDAICASVPFHLGTKMCGGPRDQDEVQYPYRGQSYLTRAQRQACAAYGGWYLMDALKTCLIVDGLREGQKRWIIRQMKRIGVLYSFEWMAHISGMEKDVLKIPEWEEEVRMACPSEEQRNRGKCG